MLKLTFSTTSTSQIKNMRKFLMFPLRNINENINEKFSKRPKRFFLLHSELVNRKKKKKIDIIRKSGVGRRNLYFLCSSMCVYVFKSCVSISLRTVIIVFSSTGNLINWEYKRSIQSGFCFWMTKPTRIHTDAQSSYPPPIVPQDSDFFKQVLRVEHFWIWG